MSASAARYLGFAFASADLLLEIDADERVCFALGAAQRAVGLEQAQIVGRSWRDLISEDDRSLVAAILEGLRPGARRGPVKLELAPTGPGGRGRSAGFSACRLPQNDFKISCALTLVPSFGDVGAAKDEHGLLDRDGFVATTGRLLGEAQAAGLDLNLQLVELRGLTAAQVDAPAEGKRSLLNRIAGVLRAESFAGEGAAQLGDDQFVVVSQDGAGSGELLGRIEKLAAEAGAEVKAEAAVLPIDAAAPPVATLRALRFALDSFLSSGAHQADAAFQAVLQATVSQANALAVTVREQRFQLVYQPVVELETGELQHFEVLLRLDADKSPAEAIHLAEELDLIADLDLSILDRVIEKLKSPGQRLLRLAVNISGRSLMLPRFMDAALERLDAVPWLADRLILEITETASLGDLDKANTAIQRLRQRGHAVFLDDFGSGASTMSYLRALAVDAVKIDGQYVRDLPESPRNRALVRHVAELCRELGIDTVGEHVESVQIGELLQSLGVRCGQGWQLGRPTAEPSYGLAAAQVRRVGEAALRR